MRVVETDCEIFQSKIIYVCGCTFKQLMKYLDETWGEGINLDWDRSVGGTATLQQVNKETAPLFLVWTKRQNDTLTLMHELIHLIGMIFTNKGVPFNVRNDESIAYYLEHWFAKFTGRKPTKAKPPKKLSSRRKTIQ